MRSSIDARPATAAAGGVTRLRLEIEGAVQGVGFRPFVYRLAGEEELTGWVLNGGRGVEIEVEGPRPRLERFLARLPAELPPRAVLLAVRPAWLPATGYRRFAIRESTGNGAKTAVVLADVATCDACLAEILDPGDRRYGYPFTNCTHCGPRFTIVRGLPYDRPSTTMAGFRLCPDCAGEYADPRDRRFHAQPTACPVCGPRLGLADAAGAVSATGEAALAAAAAALAAGSIVAVKGLGGFHLMVDARDAAAVGRLRRRKAREEKPLAVMVPDLATARRLCTVDAAAERLLGAPEAPIVLLPRRPGAAVAAEVAPGRPDLGLMLPYTPLHHLLLRRLGFPLVATSGNLSDEPIATGNREARERLGAIADLFLLHDRPIARHADDSVARLVDGAPQLVRRARGYAPLPLPLGGGDGPALLALGAHLKNAVGLAVGGRAFLSQHIGDMETPEALTAFEGVVRDFVELWEAEPVALVHDLHPDYPSTRWAVEAAGAGGWRRALAGLPRLAVQHHHAHLAACLAEHGTPGPALGVTWDGTGYGTDGTVWGGEMLLGDAAGYRRVAHLRRFRLPGGEAAVRQPRRVALALLAGLYGDGFLARPEVAALPPLGAFRRGELAPLERMIAGGLRSPWTTSAGRLFDGVAALLGLHQTVAFEGQAAMALEAAADPAEAGAYPLPLSPPAADAAGGEAAPLELDWRPLVADLVADLRRGVSAAACAARFHNALAGAVVETARHAGAERVALTGGCFQNRRLTESAARRLRRAGFAVLVHRLVPPNDGGIALGQLAVATARLALAS